MNLVLVPTARELAAKLNPTLANIQVLASASEETPCFSADLTVAGATYRVRNDGRGGCNHFSPPLPFELARELNELAADTLPRIPLHDGRTLAMDFDTWTFEVAFAQIDAQQRIGFRPVALVASAQLAIAGGVK